MQDKIVIKYGLEWHPLGKGKHSIPMPDVAIERAILADYDYLSQQPGAELLEWKEHFQIFVNIIWGRPECTEPFHWNPYSLRMLDGAVKHKMIGLCGHASSGKTRFGAVWGLAHFIIFKKCKVFFTSTTITEAQSRIWGDVEMYWHDAVKFLGQQNMPGKLVSSKHKIVGILNGQYSDKVGCAVIASGDSAKDAESKIGFKMNRVILIADELPLMRHELYAKVVGNLKSNDYFQMMGIGNLTDIFDPFGVFVEPEDGWDSISEEFEEWKTKGNGYCLRFNGEKSPNVRAGKKLYPGLLTEEGLRDIREDKGYRTPEYYRMVLSFPCPTGDVNCIYTANEFTFNKCESMAVNWVDMPQKIAFLDPAFSKGGDRAAIAICEIGEAYLGSNNQCRQTLKMIEVKDLMKETKAGNTEKDINEQLAELFIKECNTHSIPVHNRGVDATGGGSPFATILAIKGGHGTLLVSFAGAASDKIISHTDKKKGKDRFKNKVSELWYVGKEFIKSGQIRGLTKELMQELCVRKYKEVQDKVVVQSKTELKQATNGKSCDFGDAWVGCIEIARERFGFMPASKAPIVPESVVPMNPLEQLIGRREPQKASLVDIFGGSVFSGGEGSGWAE